MFLVMATTPVMPVNHAFAAPPPCASNQEPKLIQEVKTIPAYNAATNLLQSAIGDLEEAGINIINAIFSSINAIMNGMAAQFYNNIVGNPNYKAAINSLVVLYITIYGIMIMFNMASYRTGEVVSRLVKIGVVWAVMTNGWTFFDKYVSGPAIGTMNDVIGDFMLAAGQNKATMVLGSTATSNISLNPIVVSLLCGPLDYIFSLHFVVMLLTHLLLGPFGWFYVLSILWAALELVLMLIGAIITYVKSIVGLAFLFGIAPIFFAFLLFEQSRRVFTGWVNQVFGFILQPILLFAFLSFYTILIMSALYDVIFATDYCWVKWISFGILDIYWWRPFPNPAAVPNGYAGDWQGPPPIGITSVAYLLLLTHLGKQLSKFIEHLARDLSGGHGPGVVRGNDVGRWFSNHLPGVKGRSIGQLGADAFRSASYRGKNAFSRVAGLVGKRVGPTGGGTPSDQRLKENIVLVKHKGDIPIYHFSYKNDPMKQVYEGVMAQDLLHSHPDAVMTGEDGYYQVYYDKIGIEFKPL